MDGYSDDSTDAMYSVITIFPSRVLPLPSGFLVILMQDPAVLAYDFCRRPLKSA